MINIDANVIISFLNGCNFKVFMDGKLYNVLTEQSTSFDIGPFDCGSDQFITFTFVNICTNESVDIEVDLSIIDCTTRAALFDLTDVLTWSQLQKQFLVNDVVDGNYNLQVLSTDGRLIS